MDRVFNFWMRNNMFPVWKLISGRLYTANALLSGWQNVEYKKEVKNSWQKSN
jgi:hypothetical protein